MWFDIPKEISKKNTFLDYFTVSLERKGIKYCVRYLMEKNHSPYTIGHDKYAMFIKWNGENNNIAIIVGQNPAACQTINNSRFHPDDTNWNIIKILKKMGYDGYIMINTFSCIDSNGRAIKSIPPQCRNISVAKDILEDRQISNVKIILACSNSNNIAYNFIQFLSKYQNRLYRVEGYTKQQTTIPIFHFSTQSLNQKSFDFLGKSRLSQIKNINTKNNNISNNTCILNI